MSVIVMKNRDALIPGEVLEKIITECPSSFGIAQAMDGAIQRKVLSEKPSVEFIDKVQTAFKENNILFHFGKYPGGVNLDDLMPLVLLKDGDKELAVAFMEGDFIPFKIENSSHTNAFHAFHKLLRPMAEKEFKANNNDLRKFLDSWRDPLVKNQIESMCVSRLHVSLLAADGQVLTWAKPGPATHDWGWFTAVDTAPAKPKSLADMFGEKDKVTATGNVNQTKPTLKIVDHPKKEEKPAPVKTSVPEVPKEEEFTMVMMKPPSETTRSRNALKKWYRNNHPEGDLPENWTQRPAIEVKVTKKKAEKLKSFEDLAQHVDKDKLKPSPVEVKVVAEDNKITTTVIEDGKVVEETVKTTKKPIKIAAEVPPQKEEPKPVVEEPKPELPEELPVISPEVQEKLVNDMTEGHLKKIIDHGNQSILPPEKLREKEAKWPTFWEKTATHFEECAGWTPEAFIYLAKHYPEALAVLAMNLRTIAFINANEIKKLREAATNNPQPAAKKKITIAA
jgi:hypothetical protein